MIYIESFIDSMYYKEKLAQESFRRNPDWLLLCRSLSFKYLKGELEFSFQSLSHKLGKVTQVWNCWLVVFFMDEKYVRLILCLGEGLIFQTAYKKLL